MNELNTKLVPISTYLALLLALAMLSGCGYRVYRVDDLRTSVDQAFTLPADRSKTCSSCEWQMHYRRIRLLKELGLWTVVDDL